MNKYSICISLIIIMIGCTKKKEDFNQKNSSLNQTKEFLNITIIKDEYIVTLKENTVKYFKNQINGEKIKDFDEYQKTYKKKYFDYFLTKNHQFNSYNILTVTDYGFCIKADSSILELKKDKVNIQHIQNNYYIQTDLNIDTTNIIMTSKSVPWNILRVWNSSKTDGTFANAWILDTGIDPNHEDLNVNIAKSKSFVNGENFIDTRGHGTHVAGIIGAKSNNDIGVVGVAPNTPLIAIKIIDKNGRIDYANSYLQALQLVKRESIGGEVLNLSIQNTDGNQQEILLIKDIATKGCYVIIAAGNYKKNVDSDNIYPAKINGSNIFTISAFADGDKFWRTDQILGSNFGNSVDYSAPGVNIVSTLPGNKYGAYDGTSMAAPHVAGILLLHARINTDGLVTGDSDGQIDPIAHE